MAMEVGVARELMATEGGGGWGGGVITRQAETRERVDAQQKLSCVSTVSFLCNPNATMCNRRRRRCDRVSAD